MECQICYETVTENNLEILECAHGLCKKCFSLLRTSNCPFCRTPIKKITPEEQPHEIFSIRMFNNEDLEHEYDPIIIQSVRFRRRRRRNYEQRERLRDQARTNIPTIISDTEINNILNHVSTSPITDNRKHHISDKHKQKYRHNKNKWKSQLLNY